MNTIAGVSAANLDFVSLDRSRDGNVPPGARMPAAKDNDIASLDVAFAHLFAPALPGSRTGKGSNRTFPGFADRIAHGVATPGNAARIYAHDPVDPARAFLHALKTL